MKKQIKIMIGIVMGVVLIVGIIIFSFYPSEENETELIIHNKIGEAPPAPYYCTALGYIYKPIGNIAYCVFPDKTECDEWEFYRGKCGQEWSYCKLKGYELKDFERLEGWDKGAICIDPNTKEEIGNVFDLVNEEFKG